jgi:hypothetical protein
MPQTPKTPAERAAERQAKQAAEAATKAADAAKKAAEAAAKSAATAAAAVAAAPCPVPTPEEIEKKRIDEAYDKIAQNGHAVQRHGEAITQKQLEDRAVKGFDPVTGTTDDAYNKNADGTPKEHGYGAHATKWNSKAALVKADEAVRKSDDFKKAVADAESIRSAEVVVKTVKLEDALGKDYKKHVSGVTREGSKRNPTGSKPTDFTDGTIRAIYRKDAAGNWNVETMMADPKA